MSYLLHALRHNGLSTCKRPRALDLTQGTRRNGLDVDEKDCSDSGRNVIQVSE